MKGKIICVVISLLATIEYGQAQNNFGRTLKETPGVVSYTFRHSFQKDVGLTLDSIKKFGIANIEFSNLFGKTAAEIRQMLDARGMMCTSFGTSYDEALNKTQLVADNAKALGASYVRVAWIPHDNKMPFTIEIIKKAVEDFNKIGKTLKESGLTFCYHNHGYEFSPYENGTLFDYLVVNTNPEYVSFEMDILWVAHPGADPVAVMKKHGSRFKLMHVKDLRTGTVSDFSGNTSVENDVALGTGQIDVAGVIKAAKKAGVVYYYIEDESPHVNAQLPVSLAFLKKL